MTPIPLNTPEVFSQQFKRGIIIFTEMPMHDGSSRNKLLIPVNINCEDEEIYCLRCTSKIGRYEYEPYKSKGVLVAADSAVAFEVPTVIVCAEPIEYQREELSTRFCSHRLRFINRLSDDLISLVDERLRTSKDIAQRVKALIVPENVQ